MSLRDRLRQNLSKFSTESAPTQSDSNNSVYWKPKLDDNGNGTAVIRFLPNKDISKNPRLETYSFYYKNPITGQVYSEMATATFGKGIPDPMSEFLGYIWQKSEAVDSEALSAELKARYKEMKRNHYYYSNILIVSDKAQPEKVGKVFVWRYGFKINEKINGQQRPKFEDDEPVEVFDPFDSKNLRLDIKTVMKFPNYDDSVFASTMTAIADSEKEIEEILEQCHDLEAVVLDRHRDRTYEQRMENLKRCMGSDELFLEFLNSIDYSSEATSTAKVSKAKKVQEDDGDDDHPVKETPKPKKEKVALPDIPESSSDDVDDILSQLGL